MIKTFRGKLEDGAQDRIRLATIQGKVGYRISKFQIVEEAPGAGSGRESVVKIYNTEQSTIDGTVDFTDPTLLGVAWQTQIRNLYPSAEGIIFDTEIFNQDIYVTNVDVDGSHAMNYYIEVEAIPLTDMQAEYTTIKDLRANS